MWEPGLCITQRFLRTILLTSSVFILVAIATERYRRICQPLSRHINLVQCRVAIVGAVIIALLLSGPSLFIFGEMVTVSGEGVNRSVARRECGVKDGLQESVYPVLYFTLLFLLFFASSVILSCLYASIAFRIWRPRKLQTDTRTKSASLPDCRRLNAVTGATSARDATLPVANKLYEELTRSLQIRRKKDAVNLLMVPTPSFRRKKRAAYSRKRTTFIMFLMTLTSVVSYLPYIIVSIAFVAWPGGQGEERSVASIVVLELCLKSFLISSAVNPFIYGFCNQRFKKECGKLVQGFSCRVRDTEAEDTSDTPPNT